MIYFVRAVGTDFVKIGFTAGVRGRVAAMATGCPHDLVPERVVDVVGATVDAESELHRLIRQKTKRHARGEWYRLSAEEVRALANWVGQWLTEWRHDGVAFPHMEGTSPSDGERIRERRRVSFEATHFSNVTVPMAEIHAQRAKEAEQRAREKESMELAEGRFLSHIAKQKVLGHATMEAIHAGEVSRWEELIRMRMKMWADLKEDHDAMQAYRRHGMSDGELRATVMVWLDGIGHDGRQSLAAEIGADVGAYFDLLKSEYPGALPFHPGAAP